MIRAIAAAILVASPFVGAFAGEGDYLPIPAGRFASALNYEDAPGKQPVAAYSMMRTPVTNADYLAFVKTNPKWRRDRAPTVMAEKRYLSHWAGPLELGDTAKPGQPVVQVSWFAADAYCAAQGARLPTWTEWEYAAAADETRRDARSDRIWRERILRWYSRPSNAALPRAGLQPANVYGVQDLHGLVWEWTEDFSSMLMDADNRNQGDPDNARFCGAGALSMNDRDNYAVLMRVAMLSSLSAEATTANLGFRCVKDTP